MARDSAKVLGGNLSIQTHGDSAAKEFTPPEWHDAIIQPRAADQRG
jgi:hypothetical protein